ncbi:MAG: helix-turn-helix transcriptional regulator [Clostridia bacterium]|nr:helix-turn-helix transcriptional regulator [Clostridia bacterium]
MNKDFPRVMTLLREERGISQKQAANELGISQPLLSHYEKGIRECGLDFVVRAADYYDVSCDYLLGRTANRQSGQVVIKDMPEPEQVTSNPHAKTGMLNALNKKLITNSLNIIFDILDKIDSKGLSIECASCLSADVYRIFRLLYSSNPRNSQNMFAVPLHLYKCRSQAMQIAAENNAEAIANGLPLVEYQSVDRTKRPELSPEIIDEQYTALSSSLFNLIQNTEERIRTSKI